MLQNYIVTFGALSLAGLLIMILGLRVNNDWKRGIETLGAVVLHVGVFGILYHKVSIILFVALVALMLSIFVLIDPLKLATFVQPKAYRIVGLFLLFTSIAFSTMYFTNFPVWLWTIPLITYLLPHAVPPWRTRAALFHFCAWFIILIYITLSWYSVYSRFYPNKGLTFLTDWFNNSSQQTEFKTGLEPETIVIPVDKEDGSRKNQPVVVQKPNFFPMTPSTQTPVKPDTTPLPVFPPKDETITVKPMPMIPPDSATDDTGEMTAPLASDGPFLQSLRDADEKYLKLKTDYEALQKKYDELKEVNERLKTKGQAESF